MIESPVLQELLADCRRKAALETRRKDVVEILVTRFGVGAEVLEQDFKSIHADPLADLLGLAITCANLEFFRKHLSP